jgi:amidohydrolase
MPDTPDFLPEAEALQEYTRTLRRDFHQHPELGFQEIRTAGIVARELNHLGLEVTTGVGGTGVVAVIEGRQPGPILLVRADMDALPITEETGASYASLNPGIMHACGHDGHTAILLTVARMLLAHRGELAGSVKLVFQPAEEGLGGAQKMIEAGVLEAPHVDRTLGLHLWNEQPIGWIGVAQGPCMAGAEIFKITVHGKGGHAAAPHLAIDPILASAQMISAVQAIVARNVPPLQTAVVSICTIRGGETFNVIPPTVEMSGTIRTYDEAVRSLVIERLGDTVREVARAFGCRAELDLQRLTPSVVNDAGTAMQVQEAAHRLFPDARIEGGNYTTMGSEDMAFFMEKVPGCFFFVGSANHARGLDAAHHHPRFDIDEAALPHAAALMAAAVFEVLRGIEKG